MKVSHSWLQTYFEKPIPSAKELAEIFTFHAFEVENVEEKNGDSILDVKVLPDRAHYALSHAGIAEEISVLKTIPIKKRVVSPVEETYALNPTGRIDSPIFCRRYIGRYIEVPKIAESTKWVSTLLTTIGQRSINSIVDATNYVMFDVGQPLHAFDADAIEGQVHVRAAFEGEKVVLLDGREIILTPQDHVIADDKGALDIAGVKGGKRAEINVSTKRILMTACNFNPTSIRRTSTKYNLRNEASKRFENEITPELALVGMNAVCSHIKEIIPESQFSSIIDLYPTKSVQTSISVDPKRISARLGLNIPDKKIEEILESLGIQIKKDNEVWELVIPFKRLDLETLDDISEEIGRIYGYEKIVPLLPKNTTFKPQVEKTFYYAEKIKNLLTDKGFSEVYTYSLVSKGVHEIEKPLAADKNYLRTNLSDGIAGSLELNARNTDLLGLDEIRIFEIGKIFTKEGEYTSLAIGIKNVKKKKEKAKDVIKLIRDFVLETLETNTTVLCTIDDTGGIISLNNEAIGHTNAFEGIMEINLDKLIKDLPQPASYADLNFSKAVHTTYKKISPYPFIVRDIAVFVPESIQAEEVWAVIEKGITDAIGKELLARHSLFDAFKKDGKVSYAFRMVFQSMEKTLTDEEVNRIMDAVNFQIKEKGWEVR